MTDPVESRFVYVTYIRSTPPKLWAALTTSDVAEQYWLANRPEADWKLGGAWSLVFPGERVADTGEIVEFEPEKRLAIRWLNEFMPEMKAEGWSLCVMEIEPAGEAVKLTVTHTMPRERSKFIGAVSGGWPQILSNLKSLLETGTVVMTREFLSRAERWPDASARNRRSTPPSPARRSRAPHARRV